MDVSEAVASRYSCRAFQDRPVSKDTIRSILMRARQAPSGGNLQPWHVFALTGAPLKSLIDDVAAKMVETPRGEGTEYNVYPPNLQDPYEARRFKCGEDLYATIKVTREDKQGRLKQFKRNFHLFGAPVGLFFYIGRKMEPGQWSDLGMYMQTVMLLAREEGLHTCAQEAWAAWYKTLSEHLRPSPDLMLFSGMAIGYADETAPINTLRTDRAAFEEFGQLIGF